MSIGSFQRTVGGFNLTVTVSGNAITAITINDGGSDYNVGDSITPSDISSEAVVDTGVLPTDFVLTVGTVSGTGAITALTISDGGTDGTDGDLTAIRTGGVEAGVSDTTDYIDHDEYEAGGVVEEYTSPRNSLAPQVDWQGTLTGTWNPSTAPSTSVTDNDPSVVTVLKADQQQLKVQKKYIDGGTVEVFAEPTIVDANGDIVGNTVRAEDIVDEARCTALGFTWNTDGNGGVDGASYGYCSSTIVFAADLSELDCLNGGFFYDTVAGTCIDVGTLDVSDKADAADIEAYLNGGAGDAYTDLQKEQICELHGYFWDGSACVSFASVDFGATYTTQATCDAAGGVWLAGTCYSPASFGNGQGGDYSETAGFQNNL